jgi:hypothetical protein
VREDNFFEMVLGRGFAISRCFFMVLSVVVVSFRVVKRGEFCGGFWLRNLCQLFQIYFLALQSFLRLERLSHALRD